jgi:hypothetical protein
MLIERGSKKIVEAVQIVWTLKPLERFINFTASFHRQGRDP